MKFIINHSSQKQAILHIRTLIIGAIHNSDQVSFAEEKSHLIKTLTNNGYTKAIIFDEYSINNLTENNTTKDVEDKWNLPFCQTTKDRIRNLQKV